MSAGAEIKKRKKRKRKEEEKRKIDCKKTAKRYRKAALCRIDRWVSKTKSHRGSTSVSKGRKNLHPYLSLSRKRFASLQLKKKRTHTHRLLQSSRVARNICFLINSRTFPPACVNPLCRHDPRDSLPWPL